MSGSKKNSFENAILLHVFNNANIANIGDSTGLRGSSAVGSLYVALFSIAPSDSSQGTEANFTNYARVATSRVDTVWEVIDNVVKNIIAITFPVAGSDQIIRGFAICKAGVTGVDDALYWGELTANYQVTSGKAPAFESETLAITED